MLVRVWQYDVTPGHEAEFERLYSASGAWAQLFGRSADYLGTELYQAVEQPRQYLTVPSRTSARYGVAEPTTVAAIDRQAAQPQDNEPGLIPELLLCLRRQDPVSDSRRPDQLGSVPHDALGDPTANVVPADHRSVQVELCDQPQDTPRLCVGAVRT